MSIKFSTSRHLTSRRQGIYSVFAAIFSARVYPGSGRSRSTATAQIRFHNADVHVPMLTRSRSGPDHLKFAKSKAATLHLRIVLLLPDHLPSAPDFVPQYRSYLLDAFAGSNAHNPGFSNQGTPPLQVAGHDPSEIARPAGRPPRGCVAPPLARSYAPFLSP